MGRKTPFPTEVQQEGCGLHLGSPPQVLTPSKFGRVERCIPSGAQGWAGASAAPHQMSARDDLADVVQSPYITFWGATVTTWDNGDSFLSTALGNCCPMLKAIEESIENLCHIPVTLIAEAGGCGSQPHSHKTWCGISGLLARVSPLTRVLFAVGVISSLETGRRDTVLPSCACGAVHPARQPLPHSAEDWKWQKDLSSWDSCLCFYRTVIRQGDARCMLQHCVPLGQPETFFQVARNFVLLFEVSLRMLSKWCR